MQCVLLDIEKTVQTGWYMVPPTCKVSIEIPWNQGKPLATYSQLVSKTRHNVGKMQKLQKSRMIPGPRDVKAFRHDINGSPKIWYILLDIEEKCHKRYTIVFWFSLSPQARQQPYHYSSHLWGLVIVSQSVGVSTINSIRPYFLGSFGMEGIYHPEEVLESRDIRYHSHMKAPLQDPLQSK